MGNQGKLEIEKKYLYESDLELKLKNLNSVEKHSIEIIDQYYDTDDYFFIRKDYWLRSRHKIESDYVWELKYPAHSNSMDFSKYFETSDQKEIVEILSKISIKDTDSKNVDELIENLKLKIFANFKTTRKSFILDEITIDLDQTDFGYRLAEFEIILDADSTQDKIEQCMQKIKNLAKKLGKFLFF